MIQLATTYAAVGLSTAAAYLAGVHGETTPALALALVALVFVALRVSMMNLGFGRVLEDTPTGVKVMGRRVAAVALAGMLVTTSAATPVAATSMWGDECTKLDAFIYDIFTFQNVAEDPEHPCSTNYQVNQAVAELQAIDADQTHLDVYTAATAHKADEEVFMAPFGNYLNDSQSVAWMKVEAEVAESYKQGDSKAVAKVNAHTAIADYYSVKQVNLIEKWNITAQSYETMHSTVENESNLSTGAVFSYYNDESFTHTYNGVETRSVTLANGSTHDVLALNFTDHSSAYGDVVRYHGVGLSPPSYVDVRITVEPPNSNYDSVTYLELGFSRYQTPWDRIETLNTNLQSESDNFVNATWSDFEAGRINSSDVISGHTAMFEYGTRTGNNSSLYTSTAALALMGFDTPTLNSSGMMNVTYNNVTYQGLVLARSAPNGSWQANTTYNASNITGPVFMATADGRKVDLTGEFTITEMTAKDGTAIQTQNTTKYVYKTANTSELLEVQQQLIELRQEIEEREAAVGGGGGGLDLGNLTGETKAIIVLIAVAVIVVFRG